MTDLVGHVLLFAIVAVGALAFPLILGRLVRPKLPNPEKNAIYECGERTIGSSYIQFDLRFYVVALLFIVFDIEIAFFFPWATVFGTAVQLSDERLPAATLEIDSPRRILSETLLSVPPGTLPPELAVGAETARSLAWIGLCDLLAFFAILLVGFAYVWKRGDLDWVRAVSEKVKRAAVLPPRPAAEAPQPHERVPARV